MTKKVKVGCCFMEKLKIGIIGCGNIANCHAGGYKSCPDAEIIACCDIDRAKAEAFAKHYGIPNYYSSCDEMLAAHSFDGVSVCTWNSAHMECTVKALESGANVICEKPMAMNAEQAKIMKATAEKCGRLLMIGFVRRFGNDADCVRDFIKAGALGDIYYAKATYLRRNGCPGGWFGDLRYSGGGPLIDLGVHVMDLVRYLGGSPKPVSAYGVTYNNLGFDRVHNSNKDWSVSYTKGFEYTVEDMASAMIRFDNGLTMHMEASFNLNVKRDCGIIELFGTKGGAKIDPEVELYSDLGGHMVDIRPSNSSALAFNGLFDKEIAHFVDCVKNGTECRSKAEDGVVLMQMIDAVYASAAGGGLVTID